MQCRKTNTSFAFTEKSSINPAKNPKKQPIVVRHAHVITMASREVRCPFFISQQAFGRLLKVASTLVFSPTPPVSDWPRRDAVLFSSGRNSGCSWVMDLAWIGIIFINITSGDGMPTELIPPPEMASEIPDRLTPDQRVALWADLVDANEALLVAGLRRQVGPDGDIREAYRRWYAQRVEEHDHDMRRLAENLHRRGVSHGV
jgi:hypothetical protein